MALDYEALLYGPIYTLGTSGSIVVEAVLTVDALTDPVTVTIKPQLDGIALGDQVEVQTIHPAAFIRRSELVSNELTPADLDGGTLAFDGKTWRIEAHQPKPSGNGESDGEELLILAEVS